MTFDDIVFTGFNEVTPSQLFSKLKAHIDSDISSTNKALEYLNSGRIYNDFKIIDVFDKEGKIKIPNNIPPLKGILYKLPIHHKKIKLVSTYEEFLNNFHKYTKNFFEKYPFVFNYGVISGSIMMYSMIKNIDELQFSIDESDVDFFVISQEIKPDLLYNVISKNYALFDSHHHKCEISYGKNIMNIKYKGCTFQFINHKYINPNSIINLFDIDCTKLYFDGKKVLCNPLWFRAMQTGYNVIVHNNISDDRILKYNKRGFGFLMNVSNTISNDTRYLSYKKTLDFNYFEYTLYDVFCRLAKNIFDVNVHNPLLQGYLHAESNRPLELRLNNFYYQRLYAKYNIGYCLIKCQYFNNDFDTKNISLSPSGLYQKFKGKIISRNKSTKKHTIVLSPDSKIKYIFPNKDEMIRCMKYFGVNKTNSYEEIHENTLNRLYVKLNINEKLLRKYFKTDIMNIMFSDTCDFIDYQDTYYNIIDTIVEYMRGSLIENKGCIAYIPNYKLVHYFKLNFSILLIFDDIYFRSLRKMKYYIQDKMKDMDMFVELFDMDIYKNNTLIKMTNFIQNDRIWDYKYIMYKRAYGMNIKPCPNCNFAYDCYYNIHSYEMSIKK